MGCDSSQFDALRDLVPNLVTPNLRGRSVYEMVDEVRAVIEPGDVLGGVSMGSAVSMVYGVQPDAVCSALVLIAPSSGGAWARSYLDWLIAALESGGFDALRDAGEVMADFWEANYEPDHLVALWRHPPLDPIDFSLVRVPVLIAAWRDDGLHPFEDARTLGLVLPGHTFVELPTPSGLAIPGPPLAAALTAEGLVVADPDGGVGRQD